MPLTLLSSRKMSPGVLSDIKRLHRSMLDTANLSPDAHTAHRASQRKSARQRTLVQKRGQALCPLYVFLETETRSRRAYDSGFMRENIVLCEKLPGSAVSKSLPGQVKRTRETNN